MRRPHTFTIPETASRPPPFGAVGWLVAILSEQARRRAIRQELGRMTPALLRDIGLTDADVEAVHLQKLADDAANGLAAAIRNQSGNW